MNLAIDLDDTIHDTKNVPPGKKMGRPIPGAAEAVTQLAKDYRIIIHTIWATTDQRIQAIEDWLDYFEIPFHTVTNVKPDAVAYIDNKAIRFNGSWPEVLEQL